MESKNTNPKDRIGVTKVPLGSVVPAQVMGEIALGMFEGALKYGRHNYRVFGVVASVYYDATRRHLDDWWEGQDIDPDSKLNHITKAISSLVVLRDAMMNDMLTDNRPPALKDKDWIKKQNAHVKRLLKKYPYPKPPYVRERMDEEDIKQFNKDFCNSIGT